MHVRSIIYDKTCNVFYTQIKNCGYTKQNNMVGKSTDTWRIVAYSNPMTGKPTVLMVLPYMKTTSARKICMKIMFYCKMLSSDKLLLSSLMFTYNTCTIPRANISEHSCTWYHSSKVTVHTKSLGCSALFGLWKVNVTSLWTCEGESQRLN
jgi:hypothetical protein